MALYMFQGTYTPESWASMTKNPQDRSVGLAEMIQKLGGKLISLYYCFGEYDVVAIFEAPDDTTASAMVLVAISPGHAKTSKTTKLLTVQEATEAMRKASSVMYQPPSKG
ncbi:MAG: GYD domain-containing protein [Ktedonobacteraceae bacterium]